MYTQCPNCNTVFRISAQQLKAAGGRVRCGHCSHVFNALEKLLEHLPPGYTPGTPPPRKPQAPVTPRPGSAPPATPRAAPATGKSNAVPTRPSTAPASAGASAPKTTPKPAPSAKPTPPASSATTVQPAKSGIPPKPASPGSSETSPAGTGQEFPPTPPRPWKPKTPEKPRDATPSRRKVSDESQRTETAPSFKDIQLPGGPIGMDSVDWSIPDEIDDAPDLDLSPTRSEQPAGKESGPLRDETDPDDIDAFLKELAADVEAAGARLEDTEIDSTSSETLLLVDEVSPTPPPETRPEVSPEEAASPPLPPAHSTPPDDARKRQSEPAPSFDPLATIDQAPVVEPEESEEESVPASLRASLAAAEEKPRGRLATVFGMLLILVLLAGLAAQGVYFRGGAIAAEVPVLRPWLDRFCNLAQCTIPARRDIRKLALVSRDVRSDPKAKGALLITATIINNASFAQPYPDLLLTLYDLTGTAVARRQFTPAEYLADTPQALALYRAGKPMPTDTPVNIELQVIDPGKQAINYEFDFR